MKFLLVLFPAETKEKEAGIKMYSCHDVTIENNGKVNRGTFEG